MEESQRKLNSAISAMSESLHRNHLRKVYADAFNCSYRCTEDPSLDPAQFNQCVERCSSKLAQVEQTMGQEMKTIEDRLFRCVRSCEDKAKDSNDKDQNRIRSGIESCVVNCASEMQQLLPKIESRMIDQIKRL